MDWLRHGQRPAIPADCPPAYSAVFTSCWAAEPTARPTAAVALQQLTDAYKAAAKHAEKQLERAWHVDADTRRDIRSTWAAGETHRLADASAADVAKVVAVFARCPVPGMDIASVQGSLARASFCER